VQLDQKLHHGEADAQPAEFASGGAVGLAEAIEHERQKRTVDTATFIGDGQDDIFTVTPRSDANARAGGTELHRIREKIPDDLLHTVRIRRQKQGLRRVDVDGDLLH